MRAHMFDFLSQIMSMLKHLCILKIRLFGSCRKIRLVVQNSAES